MTAIEVILVDRDDRATGKMEKLEVLLPPLAEQKRIVAKVDALMALCDALELQLKDATDKQTAILKAVVAAM